MCGIFCSLFPECTEEKNILGKCRDFIQRRGPDHFSSISLKVTENWQMNLAASVLWTQGESLCKQPCELAENILCWNGDVFSGPLAEEANARKCSDTDIVSELLLKCSESGKPLNLPLAQIHGPYSMIYLNRKDGTLWFGRDHAGRHSLLWGFTKEPLSLTISSVASSNAPYMKELPAIGLFQLHLQASNAGEEFSVTLHPWCHMNETDLKTHINSLPILLNISKPILEDYIFSPICKFPVTGPSEVCANYLHQITPNSTSAEIMETFLKNEVFNANVKTLLTLLEAAVHVRVSKTRSLCQLCIQSALYQSKPSTSCSHSKVAVLFSGGLDSAILAALASLVIPEKEPIDLLNVAFEKHQNTRCGRKSNYARDDILHQDSDPIAEQCLFDVPDRLTGKQTLKELQMLYPKRKWNFIEINVPLLDLQKERLNYISHVIHPLKTVLDDSLGCALWFAARGQGKIYETNQPYTSPARIVLSGMGADEQFGGYMRHRKAFQNEGWRALQLALEEDIQRIPSRNLGRDDRVTSDHGRQSRLPYLDEAFMKFVKLLPPWERCCPNNELPRGVGDKLLLRLVAWQIGFRDAALLPKRALQFGSRIANSKENASNVSVNL